MFVGYLKPSMLANHISTHQRLRTNYSDGLTKLIRMMQIGQIGLIKLITSLNLMRIKTGKLRCFISNASMIRTFLKRNL
jgi:hypothetical protein